MITLRSTPFLHTRNAVHQNTRVIFFTTTWIEDLNVEVGVPTISEHQEVSWIKIISTGKSCPSRSNDQIILFLGNLNIIGSTIGHF
uniref:Uncharacterized protein n=1 Tax=Arundo donax TaxID=35708 RepID=A0A0A9EBW3_ARUDO